MATSLPIKDLYRIDTNSFDYVYEENVSISLKCQDGLVRANVYRPKSAENMRYPVLVTYGPYGKDIHYSNFHASSFSELPTEHKSPHSSWETPDPGFWTKHGFAIVRADEVGTGQSPGHLDTMSKSTSQCFKDVIEWAAEQRWSTGKIGLLGISYYAGSQWRVAALQPKGLACIIPWEGMSDYYRDRCRHGGILSNTFVDFWWRRQIITNQYGLPGRAARNWGPDTLEGDLSEQQLERNRFDQTIDNANYRYLDDDYYATKVYDLKNIQVPLLSVGNWGGILLHLRGNVEGYMGAGSALKYLRFVVGRHDLPFYSKAAVELQLSFLNAFLKDDDAEGWKTEKPAKVGLILRKGDLGFNDPIAEEKFPQRFENEWPIARTSYTKYYLHSNGSLDTELCSDNADESTASYQALGDLKNPQVVHFTTPPFPHETEFTGHILAHLNVSASRFDQSHSTADLDMDIFITIRHISAGGKEVVYTGTVGDPVPVSKGWLRVSLRKTNPSNPRHETWRPFREYKSSDVEMLKDGEVYTVDVEVWPTNVVVEAGARLVLEISSGDTQGAGLFEHNHRKDRKPEVFEGMNHVHFGEGRENWLLMPVIPEQA